MGLVLAIVSLVLLLVQVLLIARAVLDWAVVLAGPSAYGSVRSRLSAGVFAVTEPIPDDPGELSPDTPETLPPAPVEPMPGPDDPDSIPNGDPGPVPEPA